MKFLAFAFGALLTISTLHAEDDLVKRAISELGKADATAQPDHIERWKAVLSRSATISGDGAEVWTLMTGALKSPLRTMAESQIDLAPGQSITLRFPRENGDRRVPRKSAGQPAVGFNRRAVDELPVPVQRNRGRTGGD